MLLLASTSDLLRVTTGQACDIDVHASWIDLNGTTVTPGRTNTLIATATTTTVVSSPASSTYRTVKSLHIRNREASDSCDITVFHTDGTNAPELVKVTLLAGESLLYEDGVGFVHRPAQFSSFVSGSITVVKLSGDASISSTTPAEITGLQASNLTAGTYVFKYYLIYQSATATVGVRFDVNFTGTSNEFVWTQRWTDASATASTAAADQDAIQAAGHVVGGFASRAKGTAGRGTTISVDTINADMLMIIEGIFEATGTGDLELYHGSETATSTTVKADSSLVLIKTG